MLIINSLTYGHITSLPSLDGFFSVDGSETASNGGAPAGGPRPPVREARSGGVQVRTCSFG